MRRFYEEVWVDDTMRFFTACSICGKRKYAGRLPLLYRSKDSLGLLEQGKGGKYRQAAYNRRKTSVVQHLARFFNRCTVCGKWVCDDCFHPNAGYGACHNCINKEVI